MFPNLFCKRISGLLCISLLASIGLSCSTDKLDRWTPSQFVKVDSVNPILLAGPGRFFCPIRKDTIDWESKDVFNPAAVVHQGKVWLMYRAEDSIGRFNGTSRIGLASSTDGLHFIREPEPVFYPDNDSMMRHEWEGGVEDPRVVRAPDGRFVLTYTAYDGKTARLCIAFSADLRTWHKAGTVLRGEHQDRWSKSGAIVAAEEQDRMVAKRIPCSTDSPLKHSSPCEGHYWMYFGDTDIFMAWSDDLLVWNPLTKDGNWLPVLNPRPGKFDSRLVEPGPFAIWRKHGIMLMYNGMNLDQGGDPHLEPGTYAPGQALFDPAYPSKLRERSEGYLFRPEKSYEMKGQVNRVCFVEGLVHFNGRWLLYYGTADSGIAAAVAEN